MPFKKLQNAGTKNIKWKGDKVGYAALHEWVSRTLGKPMVCSACGVEGKKKYEWANLSGEYKRDVKDWRRICVPCHRKHDGHIKKAWINRKSKFGLSGVAFKKRVARKDSVSKVAGVHFHKQSGGWIARGKKHDGKLADYLGYFQTKDDAKKARDKYEQKVGL